jgi:hypothetical protein
MGFPVEIGGVVEKVDDPVYATALGTMVWGMREEEHGFMSGSVRNFELGKAAKQVSTWIKSLFP